MPTITMETKVYRSAINATIKPDDLVFVVGSAVVEIQSAVPSRKPEPKRRGFSEGPAKVVQLIKERGPLDSAAIYRLMGVTDDPVRKKRVQNYVYRLKLLGVIKIFGPDHDLSSPRFALVDGAPLPEIPPARVNGQLEV